MKRETQKYNWVFTDFELLNWEKIFQEGKFKYIIIGKELCPKTKKLHYQGYLQMITKTRMSALKRLIECKKIHLEQAKGTAKQCVEYSKKDKNWTEFGQCKHKGERTDLRSMCEDIDNGASLRKINQDYPANAIRYSKGIIERRKRYLHKITEDVDRNITVELYYGRTGVGKTRKAREDNPGAFWIHGDAMDWWDGYDGQKTVVIDEYNNDVKITTMLKYLDRYQCRLPVKGSFTYAQWTKVVITSNLTPDEIHPMAKPKHREALMRRITKKLHMKKMEP